MKKTKITIPVPVRCMEIHSGYLYHSLRDLQWLLSAGAIQCVNYGYATGHITAIIQYKLICISWDWDHPFVVVIGQEINERVFASGWGRGEVLFHT
jgi:hypothetical protein